MDATSLAIAGRWLQNRTPLSERQCVVFASASLAALNVIGLLREPTPANQEAFWKFIALLAVSCALVLVRPNRFTRIPMLLVVFTQAWGWTLLGLVLGFFRRPALLWVSLLAASPALLVLLLCSLAWLQGLKATNDPSPFAVPNLVLHGVFWALCTPYITMLTRGWWFARPKTGEIPLHIPE